MPDPTNAAAAYDYAQLPEPLPRELPTLEFLPKALHQHYARTFTGTYTLQWIDATDEKTAAARVAEIASGAVVRMTEPGMTPAALAADREAADAIFREALATGEKRQAAEQAAQAEARRQAQARRDAMLRERSAAGLLTPDDYRLLRQADGAEDA